ncbi:MAG: hypothetical protein E2O40_02785 [Planctomycetota bacterium]|nr:MAG: hypothetical protein E2O40_02785 [Planctomycetota bacterium]
MSKRNVLVALSACAVIGIALTRNASSGPKLADLSAPDVPSLLGYTMTRLAVPLFAGDSFDVAVSIGGDQLVVNLDPYTIRSNDFQVFVDHGDGQLVPVEAPPPTTYRGAVAGIPGSWATASLIDGQLHATVMIDGAAWTIEPLDGLAHGAQVTADSYAIYRDEDIVPADKGCGGAIANPGAQPAGEPAAEGGVAGGTGLEIIELGCDADVEYWIKNGSSVDNTVTDIETIINSVSAIYEAQGDLAYEVTTIVVRTGAAGSDPYSSSICGTLLSQFRSTWGSPPENFIRRDVAHLFTGRNLADNCLGVAYLAGLCQGASGFGYGVVESRSPGLPFHFRVGLSSHELGHNFNSLHCSGASCRIMCGNIGGCSGIVTSFGASSISSITNYANGLFCLADQPLPLEPPFFEDFPSTTLNQDNWTHANGVLINGAATNEPSPSLSLNLDAIGAGEYQFNEIRTNFINLSGLDGTGFFVQFFTQAVGVEVGEKLQVDYWSGPGGGFQWKSLATIASDGTNETTFTQHTIFLDDLVPSPFHSEFRVRFKTVVNSSNDDWYIDNVFISGTPPPSNDACSAPLAVSEGSFPFTTIGATTDGLPLFCDGGGGGVTFDDDTWFLYTPSCTAEVTFSTCNAADFDTRLAVYFEASCPPSSPLACSDDAAECGVTSEVTILVTPLVNYLVRVGATIGGGTGTLTISCPAANPCPWDLDDSGDVGINDFLDLLAAWGTDPGGPPDFDGDGDVGINDFLELLAHWGSCP